MDVACPAAAPSAGPWYASVSPSEHGNDSQRTHLYAGACPGVTAEHPRAAAVEADGLPELYNAVTRQPDEVFALGGSFGHIAETGGPYVVALDARSMRHRWRTSLPGIAAPDWNYPGAVGVHADGDLYAVYGHNLARLDPETGAVKAHVDLPVNQPAGDVAYNGFVLMSDGRIATKSIHRKPGCPEPDFQAFLRCGTSGVAASTVVVLDPSSLAIAQSLVAPEHVRFRATVGRFQGDEYLYMPGEDRIRRYRYEGGRLTLDDTWSAAYRAPGQTPGTAVAVLGEWIVIQTNGIPAEAPLSVVAVSQRDARRQFRIEPFAESSVEGSFIPSLPTVDPENRRVYTFDGFAGELAALHLDDARGFSVAWRVSQRSFAFGALVGPPAARVLIGTSLEAFLPSLFFRYAGFGLKLAVMRRTSQRPREAVVWREAVGGRELGRTGSIAAVAGSPITPGASGWLFVPDLHGGRLLRLSAS